MNVSVPGTVESIDAPAVAERRATALASAMNTDATLPVAASAPEAAGPPAADAGDHDVSVELRRLQERLGAMTFFDPACGCGNFLIIAYRELRLLEIEVLKAIRVGTQQELDAATLSQVDVDQFHGIEIGEFPVRIAETAMWMMDHIMNNWLI